MDTAGIHHDRRRTGGQWSGRHETGRWQAGNGRDDTWPYLVHNLIYDFAALNGMEKLLRDTWGMMRSQVYTVPEQLELLDTLADTRADGAPVDHLRARYERDEFRAPDVVTSYSAALETPFQVPIDRKPGPIAEM